MMLAELEVRLDSVVGLTRATSSTERDILHHAV
jgi:hypothetical protein